MLGTGMMCLIESRVTQEEYSARRWQHVEASARREMDIFCHSHRSILSLSRMKRRNSSARRREGESVSRVISMTYFIEGSQAKIIMNWTTTGGSKAVYPLRVRYSISMTSNG